MFRYAAWAAGRDRSGPPAAETVGTKSTGGCYQQDVSPCRLEAKKALRFANVILAITFLLDDSDRFLGRPRLAGLGSEAASDETTDSSSAAMAAFA